MNNYHHYNKQKVNLTRLSRGVTDIMKNLGEFPIMRLTYLVQPFLEIAYFSLTAPPNVFISPPLNIKNQTSGLNLNSNSFTPNPLRGSLNTTKCFKFGPKAYVVKHLQNT